MESGNVEHLATLLHVLASPTRLRIIDELQKRPCYVGELACLINRSQPGTTHQLKILEKVGLVAQTHSAPHTMLDYHYYTVIPERLAEIAQALTGAIRTPATRRKARQKQIA